MTTTMAERKLILRLRRSWHMVGKKTNINMKTIMAERKLILR